MIQFIPGAFTGSVVTFAVLAFIIAVSEEEHDRKRK